MHIGLVEEDAALGGLLKEAFSREGCTVTLLEDPRALALVFYLRNLGQAPLPYDLLVVDLHLEKQELELLARLQASLQSRRLPLIVLTSADQQQTEEARRAFPALLFMRKPFRLAKLLAAIETVSGP